MIWAFSASASRGAICRAVTSAAPPAVDPETILTSLAGYGCATAAAEIATDSANKNRIKSFTAKDAKDAKILLENQHQQPHRQGRQGREGNQDQQLHREG